MKIEDQRQPLSKVTPASLPIGSIFKLDNGRLYLVFESKYNSRRYLNLKSSQTGDFNLRAFEAKEVKLIQAKLVITG